MTQGDVSVEEPVRLGHHLVLYQPVLCFVWLGLLNDLNALELSFKESMEMYYSGVV